MKFEHVLQVYWAKGFLCAGNLHPFEDKFRDFGAQVFGFGRLFKMLIVKRFELSEVYSNLWLPMTELGEDCQGWINVLLSQVTSVNHQVSELEYYDKVRLYLIKSYRGRAHALGKPARGQRTWSNAWTSYYANKTVRRYIAVYQKNMMQKAQSETLNFKKLKKKVRQSSKSSDARRKIPVKKKTLWF